MDLPSQKVFDVLLSKGIKTLYHANSVLTACHFLRDGHLSSRGTVESYKIPQTPQYSDADDKRYSVWFDIFTDTVDIHNRAKRRNSYGPVLFVLDIESLKSEVTGRIWVTKLNPTKWASLGNSERWFQSIDELKANLTPGTFDQMIVFRHCGGRLPVRKSLKQIVLDDTNVRYVDPEIDFAPLAYGALTLAMTQGGKEYPIRLRKCDEGCKCEKQYGANLDQTEQMFSPRVM